MRVLLLLCFFMTSILFSQEKRLALVIGNSNYDKGALKNPVNDARLIASTLDSLNFEVILKENIETQGAFNEAILEFGKKRSNYDVAFVYYAGHGVQVENENYLLPTKEEFTSEDEVVVKAVSVQNIMRFLKSQTDQVNILILDACRDNPFESNFNITRSLKGGRGLARIPPPNGSLIAFSTDSGKTAPDGEGDNSFYSLSLSKNMKLGQISIDQVFRNVRSEVYRESNETQRPVEYTQLTGETYYLTKRDFDDELKQSDRLIKEDKIKEAIILLKSIHETDPKNLDIVDFLSKAYYENGINYSKKYEFEGKSQEEFKKAFKLLKKYIPENIDDKLLNKDVDFSPKTAQLFYRKSRLLYTSVNSSKFLNKKISFNWDQIFFNMKMALKYDPLNPFWDYYYGTIYSDLYKKPHSSDLANRFYKRAINKYLSKIEEIKNDPELFFYLSFCYFNTNQIELGFQNLVKASNLAPKNIFYLEWLASKYWERLNYLKSNEIFDKAIAICNNCPNLYLKRAGNYMYLKDFDKAISDYSLFYNLTDIEEYQNDKIDRGLAYYYKAEENSDRSDLSFENFNNAIIDFSFSINSLLKSNNQQNINDLINSYSLSAYEIKNLFELISHRAKSFFKISQIEYYNNSNYFKSLDSSQNNYKILIDNDFFGDGIEFIIQYLRIDYLKGEFDEVIKKGNKIISKHVLKPQQLAVIYGFMGMTSWTINDNKSSLIYYKKALDLELTAENHDQYAVALFEDGNHPLALFHFNKSIELEPEESTHWNNRAEYYFKTNDYKRAENDIIKAISINDYFDLDANLLLIKIKVERNDFEGQLYYANEILTYMSDDLRSYYWLAEIYLNQKRYIKSIINLSKVIDLFEDNNDSTQNKVTHPLLVSYNDYGNTISEDHKEIVLSNVLLKRAELFKLIGNDLDACEDLNKALELDNDDLSIKEKINEICN